MKKDKKRTGNVEKNKFDESAKKYFCPQILFIETHADFPVSAKK